MDSIDLYNRLLSAPLDEFGSYFDSFKKSAFRLEMLDLYTVPEEQVAFKQFLSGEMKLSLNFHDEWITMLRNAISQGKSFERVRLVRKPIHEYVKFEVVLGYTKNVQAGEKIGIILYEHLPIFNSAVPVLNDFWLFDDTDCFLMEYDFLGHFLGVKRVPSQFISPYVNLKREALSRAVPLESSPLWEYVTEHR